MAAEFLDVWDMWGGGQNDKSEGKAVPGLGWPRGFQEVKVRRFLDNGTG
jgi:hypothetical protein